MTQAPDAMPAKRRGTLQGTLAFAAAAAPFVLLAAVLQLLPLPPARLGPVPWSWAIGNAALLFGAFVAHTVCYARWQPHAPRRILVNEALARLWFVAYGVILVGRATPHGFVFLLLALPWAALCWEVHRADVRRRGYDVAWNLAAWGLFLLGLALFELLATWA